MWQRARELSKVPVETARFPPTDTPAASDTVAPELTVRLLKVCVPVKVWFASMSAKLFHAEPL